ncbi:hypothetical protein [Agrococcus sp. Marseille-Q4369]|uniref:hypothetical protein n=1 Tax=Agrococcus sp. Marseille-Q4369 TaxID=2810513 RepID=UPI001B8C4F10|nr:hypothetical protein [Agrococcus sp. Marseille-Q4369]QUW19788.1 hypothetical protein JSQ78_05760 [Agrococcus sp. Marseille-Q4369]
MAEEGAEEASGETASAPRRTVYRSRITGRVVSQAERIAAARARIVADEIRGIETEPWIVELAKQSA